MRSRAYGSIGVNQVDVVELVEGRQGQDVHVGLDVGKYGIYAVARWPDRRFERPWRVGNPSEIPRLVKVLQHLCGGRQLVVALEPSGTYGDAVRQALADAEISVLRVSPKAAHDYAEVFDGVPSQHDGKDAAVVAELAAIGKGKPWLFTPPSAWEQELAYWVERLDYQQRIKAVGLGMIEALLGRHWPEATQILKVSSGTLLRTLAHYGGPAALAGDAKAAEHLTRWGRSLLERKKVEQLLASARETVGVRQGEWDQRRLREHAEQTRAAHQEVARCRRQLRALAKGHVVLEAHARAVGMVTACVLWVGVGDPRDYSCGRAYRKAMGLNLVERSSGIYKGKLKISKRGDARTRKWLYLATLRLVKEVGVRQWYQAKKARDGQGTSRRALVAVMRKLPLALYQLSVKGVAFNARRLFAGVVKKRQAAEPTSRAERRR